MQPDTIISFCFKIVYFLKMKSIKISVVKIERLMIIAKMITNAIILSHWIACFWNLLAELQIDLLDADDTWQHVNELQDSVWYIKYLFSFYWATATIMLVGPVTNNSFEVLFTSTILYATVGIFAYLISEINSILEELNQKEKIYVADFKAINLFMRQRNIGKELQGRIRNFLEYYFESHDSVTSKHEIERVLEKLPKNLKEDLVKEINKEIIEQFPQFFSHLSKRTVDKIIPMLKEKQFLPSEMVYRNDEPDVSNGDINDVAIYFIKQGTAEIICSSIKKPRSIPCLYKINKPEVVGVQAFYSGLYHQFSVRCITECQVYQLSRIDFLEILRMNKTDLEAFCNIKDDIFLRDYSLDYGLKCSICNSKFHSDKNCNLVHHSPNYNMTIHRLIKSYDQKRRYWRRGLRLDRFNPRVRKFDLEEAKEKCYEDLNIRQIIFDYMKFIYLVLQTSLFFLPKQKLHMERDEIINDHYFNELDSADLESELQEYIGEADEDKFTDNYVSIQTLDQFDKDEQSPISKKRFSINSRVSSKLYPERKNANDDQDPKIQEWKEINIDTLSQDNYMKLDIY